MIDSHPNAGATADTVTEEDVLMVSYFLKEKGDITRWSSWKDRKKVILKKYPALGDAISRLASAEQTLKMVVDGMEWDDDE